MTIDWIKPIEYHSHTQDDWIPARVVGFVKDKHFPIIIAYGWKRERVFQSSAGGNGVIRNRQEGKKKK